MSRGDRRDQDAYGLSLYIHRFGTSSWGDKLGDSDLNTKLQNRRLRDDFGA